MTIHHQWLLQLPVISFSADRVVMIYRSTKIFVLTCVYVIFYELCCNKPGYTEPLQCDREGTEENHDKHVCVLIIELETFRV